MTQATEFAIGDLRVWSDGRKGKITGIEGDNATVEFSDNVVTTVTIDEINRETVAAEPPPEGAAA